MLKLIVLTLILSASSATVEYNANATPSSTAVIAPGAFLAINALAFTDPSTGAVIRRRLELNWFLLPTDVDHVTVALFNQDPDQVASVPVLTLDADLYPEGFYVTDIQLENVTNSELGFEKRCAFPYWIQLLDASDWSNTITSPRCLTTQPTWMEDNKAQIGGFPLNELMLVAAHDASAWKQYENEGDDNWATSSVFTQEENLLAQLQYGVRFQDMRIGYYPTTPERFWLVHSIIKVHPLQMGLDLISEFLRNSRDVIVWDSHSFELGTDRPWPAEVHDEYQALLHETFDRWWVKPGTGAWTDLTLNDVWAQNGLPADEGRIIHMYEDNNHFDPELFFPNIPEYWGNKDDPEELKEFLDVNVALSVIDPEEYDPCWRPNCQMTPTGPDIILEKYSGLREMADLVNRNMSLWWRTDYREVKSVFTLHDFVVSSDMVQVAIERNLRTAEDRRRKMNTEEEGSVRIQIIE